MTSRSARRRAERADRAERDARTRSTIRARSSTSTSRLPWLLLGGAAMIAVAVLAIVTTSGAPSRASGAGASSVAASATVGDVPSLPLFTGASVDPAVGRPIPEARGTDFDGSTVAIEHDGRPKVLLFVAHWCPHCQAEVPVVQAWLDAGRLDPAVDLISVATGIDPVLPNYPPDAWLEREHWSPPVLVDGDQAVATSYGLKSFPYWVVVDAAGKVAARTSGELSADQLDALVAAAAR
jgi:thiol-disulfide isomerase/thioredoxin